MESGARQLVREGVVTVVYPARHSARVEFADKDNLVSAELPILSAFALGNKSYALPDVGDTVVCLFATNSNQVGDGYILGAHYTDKTPPAANSQDITRFDFKDGTFISYDRANHELKINCVGNIKINGRRIDLNE